MVVALEEKGGGRGGGGGRSLRPIAILFSNKSRHLYQYSEMGPRLSLQTSIFGGLYFVSKCFLGIEGQKKLTKFAVLTRKFLSHVRILICQK